jgi:hypothetical protein
MSETSKSLTNSTLKRKPKDLKNNKNKDKPIKRLGTESEGDSESNQLSLVPVTKTIIAADEENSDSDQLVPRFAVDFSANPLSSYNTFVCHLGNWKAPLQIYLKNPQFESIFNYVRDEYDTGVCNPPRNLIFNAFLKTPFDKLKVVMLGSSPSLTEDESMGLSFSAKRNIV